jgi:hypothetical protein
MFNINRDRDPSSSKSKRSINYKAISHIGDLEIFLMSIYNYSLFDNNAPEENITEREDLSCDLLGISMTDTIKFIEHNQQWPIARLYRYQRNHCRCG